LGRGVLLDLFERGDEARGPLLELTGVIAGESREKASAFGGEAEENAALVSGIGGAGKEAFAHGAIDKLDSAVVAETEPLRCPGDGDGDAGWRPGNLQKQLMLMGLETGVERGRLAELEEGAEGGAEFCERTEEGEVAGGSRRRAHIYIVTRCILRDRGQGSGKQRRRDTDSFGCAERRRRC
jgi:hypothetical protein